MRLIITLILFFYQLAFLPVSANQLPEPSKSAIGSSVNSVHLVARHDGYDVDVCYPRFRGESAKKLNRLVKHMVNTNVAAKPSLTRIPNHYFCKYEICCNNGQLLSIDFEFRSSEASGDYHKALNLELKPEIKEITFQRVFGTAKQRGRNRLYENLSDLCIERLGKELKSDLSLPQNTEIINEDLLPSFDFTNQGIEFWFSPGYVSSKELGCSKAFIDLTFPPINGQ